MDIKTFKKVQAVVVAFVGLIVAVSVVQDSYLLASIGVLVGIVFLILARSKTKIIVDEREKTVREKAAQVTYAIFAPVIGISSFFLLIVGKERDLLYLESLGTVLAYLALLLISLYAVSYYFLNRKYGGGKNEE